MSNIYEKLMNIQSQLKAPKDSYNSFGKYAYRNTESILEALKPLLASHKTVINVSDEVELVGDRYYIKATARLIDVEKDNEYVEATAYAREGLERKGMDLSQLTGSTSSYARKYALNGLLAIDDTKDSDTTNKGKSAAPKKAQDKPALTKQASKPKQQSKATISTPQARRMFALADGDSDIVKQVLDTFGYKGSTDVEKAKYQAVCEAIEKSVQAGEDKQ